MDIGIHTPEHTKFTLDVLRKYTPFKWEDASWVNDQADSLYCSKKDIHVYVPNFDDGHKTYGLILDLWKSTHKTIEFEDIYQVINYIKNN
jgi:hypothetical protein